jgi:hypothetical protein
VWCPRQNKRIAPLPFFHCRKRLIAFIPEIDDQRATGLPPVTSVTFLIANMYISYEESRFIPEGIAEASQIFLRDAHVLPELLS